MTPSRSVPKKELERWSQKQNGKPVVTASSRSSSWAVTVPFTELGHQGTHMFGVEGITNGGGEGFRVLFWPLI